MRYTSVFLSLILTIVSANDISVDYECSTFKQIYRKSECCEDSKAHIHLNYTCPDASPCPSPSPPSPVVCPPLSPTVCPPPPPVSSPCEHLICQPVCKPTVCPPPPPPTVCPSPPPPPSKCDGEICTPICPPPTVCPECPVPSPPIVCPVCPSPSLPPPPPPCPDAAISEDALDIIHARDILKISFPSTEMTGFASLKSCKLCKNPRPYGLLGDLVKIASISIFGEYYNEKVVVVEDNNSKFLDIYENNVDIAFSFAVETNEPRSFIDHNGLQHTADFDLDTPYMKSSPAMTIKPEFYRQCDICKHLDLRGKLLRAVFKKKHLYPSAATFILGVTQTPASVNVAHMMVETMNTYIKEKSGIDVLVADPGLEWDAMIGPDFLLGGTSPNVVLFSESDVSNYHLDYSDTHSLVYTTGTAKVPVRNTKLKNVVDKAVSCLSLMDKLGVQTVEDVTTPYLQAKLAGTCTKVLEAVGSGKTVNERVYNETSYPLDAFH